MNIISKLTFSGFENVHLLSYIYSTWGCGESHDSWIWSTVTIAASIWDEWFRSYRDLCLIQASGWSSSTSAPIIMIILWCSNGSRCVMSCPRLLVEMVRNRTGLMKYWLGWDSRCCLCVYGK